MRYCLKRGLLLCYLLSATCFGAKGHVKQEVLQSSSVDGGSLQWETYEQVMEKAKQDGRYIGLFFTGSDWCMWCMKMHEQILNTPEFVTYARSNLHMVIVDFPQKNHQPKSLRDLNRRLKSEYAVSGFPTLVFIDATGKEHARMGFEPGGGEAYVRRLQSALGVK